MSTASDTQRGYAPRIGIEKQASLRFAGNNSWLPQQQMDMSSGSNFKKGGTGHTNKGCHLFQVLANAVLKRLGSGGSCSKNMAETCRNEDGKTYEIESANSCGSNRLDFQ